MDFIQSEDAPKAIGPYSQGVVAGGFIFCSGQVGGNPKTGTIAKDIEGQTRQVLLNIENVLRAAGATLQDVVKTTVYLKNVADFPRMNAVYAECFGEHKPARATIQAGDLPKGKFDEVLVEIEAIAHLKT